MEENNAWKSGDKVLLVLLLLGTILTASRLKPGAIDLSPLGMAGDRMDIIILTVGLVGVFVVLSLLGGLAFRLLLPRLDKTVQATKEDEAFIKNSSNLDKMYQAQIDELQQSRPVDPIPEHKRPRWSAFSTGLLVFVMVLMAAPMISRNWPHFNLFGLEVSTMTSLMALTAAMVYLKLRPALFTTADDNEGLGVQWHWVWVIAIGALVLGIGFGLTAYYAGL